MIIIIIMMIVSDGRLCRLERSTDRLDGVEETYCHQAMMVDFLL